MAPPYPPQPPTAAVMTLLLMTLPRTVALPAANNATPPPDTLARPSSLFSVIRLPTISAAELP